MKTLRVLVVDDSALNRRALTELLASIPNVEVCDTAGDGEEALRILGKVQPDLITLDLEMPRLDGFAFLRLLMAKRPTPVIVISGFSTRENVLRALELGALDFIAKPSRTDGGDLSLIRQELLAKVEIARNIAPFGVDPQRRGISTPGRERDATARFTIEKTPRPTVSPPPTYLLAIAASTGGPGALVELFGRLPEKATAVVAQHMPEKFTKTFAERLDRVSPLSVTEAVDGMVLRQGIGVVCPGGYCIEVDSSTHELVVKVKTPLPTDRYVPSADRLFESAAREYGDRVIAVVLTGMGDDGSRGVSAVKQAGGRVFAEAPESAVIYGMPGAAVRTGAVDRSMPLRRLCDHLADLTR